MFQKCLTVLNEDFVWDVKRKLLASLPQALPQAFNYGLFLPPCDGRAGKFLLEDRTIRDYPFHDCVPYLEVSSFVCLGFGCTCHFLICLSPSCQAAFLLPPTVAQPLSLNLDAKTSSLVCGQTIGTPFSGHLKGEQH